LGAVKTPEVTSLLASISTIKLVISDPGVDAFQLLSHTIVAKLPHQVGA